MQFTARDRVDLRGATKTQARSMTPEGLRIYLICPAIYACAAIGPQVKSGGNHLWQTMQRQKFGTTKGFSWHPRRRNSIFLFIYSILQNVNKMRNLCSL
jgi:hypothetical protein